MTKAKVHVRNFQTFDKFIHSMENVPSTWAKPSSVSGTKDFTGTDTFQDALDLAVNGYPDGRKLMTDITDNMEAVGIQFEARNQIKIDVGGSRPHIARAVAGDPVSMISNRAVQVRSKVIQVVVSSCAHAGVANRDIARRGGAVISYLHALETAGWRIELVLNLTAREYGDDIVEINIVIKEPEQILDLDRVAFAFCHPSMLRRLLFRVMEQIPEAEKKFSGSYGSPKHERPEGCDIYIPMFEPSNNPIALEKVKSILDAELIDL